MSGVLRSTTNALDGAVGRQASGTWIQRFSPAGTSTVQESMSFAGR
ncbi:hypothetical protein ACWF0M_21660 [Kribbella sp. NPDC055110]